MICKKCGAELPEGAKVCMSCVRLENIRHYKRLFYEEFPKGLQWERDTLEWSFGCPPINISYMAMRLRKCKRYYGDFVGTRGGLPTEALLLLRGVYNLEKELTLQRFEDLAKIPAAEFQKLWNRQLEYGYAVDMYECSRDVNEMIHRKYLQLAFESLKSEMDRSEGSIKVYADEMRPLLSKLIPGKSQEELEAFSQDAAVVKMMVEKIWDKHIEDMAGTGIQEKKD